MKSQKIVVQFILIFLNIKMTIAISYHLSSKAGENFIGTWEFNLQNSLGKNNTENNDDDQYEIVKDYASASSLFNNFKNNHGIAEAKLFNSKRDDYHFFTIILSLLDGEYKENWISITKEYRLNSKDVQGDEVLEFNTSSPDIMELNNKKVLIKTLNLFKVNQRFKKNMKRLGFEINNHNDYQSFNGFMEMNEYYLNITMEMRNNHNYENSFHHKSFLFIVMCLGFGQIIMFYFVIHMQYKRGTFTFNYFSHFFLAFDIVWNMIIFEVSINMSFSSTEHSHAYATVAFFYFISFSFFEGVIFYFSYDFLRNQRDIQRMILTVSISILLFFLLIIFMFTLKLLIIVFLMSTFIPQIIYNATLGDKRNKIPRWCIAMVSINRIYIPLYIKLLPFNLFKAKINEKFSLMLFIGHMIQIIVLRLQQEYGGDCILPRRFQIRRYYDYKMNIKTAIRKYKDFKGMTCAICLEKFVLNDESDSEKMKEMTAVDVCGGKDVQVSTRANKSNVCLWGKIKNKLFKNNNSYVMKTPCDHFFHKECLTMWIIHLNCPNCREPLPQMY